MLDIQPTTRYNNGLMGIAVHAVLRNAVFSVVITVDVPGDLWPGNNFPIVFRNYRSWVPTAIEQNSSKVEKLPDTLSL